MNNQEVKRSETNSYRDRRFVVSHEKMFMKHKIDFKKNNMFIYQHESSLIAAESDVIDLIDSSRLPSEAYICPNCGSMSSSDELSSTGCPFCGRPHDLLDEEWYIDGQVKGAFKK